LFGSLSISITEKLPLQYSPLGHKQGANLTGLCKIKLLKLGIRVVYKLVREGEIMKIIVIAARADEEVYSIASRRVDT